MSYIFEKVGKNKELWTEIGFRNLELENIPYTKYIFWCADKKNKTFLFHIGNSRGDDPNYFDLSYKMRIIRIAVVESIEQIGTGIEFIYNIQRISIPRSVWEERNEILRNIEESINEDVHSMKLGTQVIINCDPECIESDYNGR